MQILRATRRIHMRINNSCEVRKSNVGKEPSLHPHINRILWQNHKFSSTLSALVFRYAMQHPFPQEVASKRPTHSAYSEL